MRSYFKLFLLLIFSSNLYAQQIEAEIFVIDSNLCIGDTGRAYLELSNLPFSYSINWSTDNFVEVNSDTVFYQINERPIQNFEVEVINNILNDTLLINESFEIDPFQIENANLFLCDSSIAHTLSIINPDTTSFTYNWLDLDEFNCCGTEMDSFNLYQELETGNYTIQADNGNCSVEATITVEESELQILDPSFYYEVGFWYDVYFTANVTGADQVIWFFEDGSTEAGVSVSHYFSSTGNQTITLMAIDTINNCVKTSSQTIYVYVIICSNREIISNLNISNFQLSPIPANDYLDIRFDCISGSDIEMKLLDQTGRVHFKSISNALNYSERIDISNLSSGLYFLAFESEKGNFVEKVFIR